MFKYDIIFAESTTNPKGINKMSYFDTEAEKQEFISEIETVLSHATSVAELDAIDDNYESCEPYHSLGLTYKLFDKALNDFGFSVAEQISNVYNGEPWHLDQWTELGEFPDKTDVKRTEISKYVFDVILGRIETAEDCYALLFATDTGSSRFMIVFEKLFTYDPSQVTPHLGEVLEIVYDNGGSTDFPDRSNRNLFRRIFDYCDQNDL